jgi:hypothetical protein
MRCTKLHIVVTGLCITASILSCGKGPAKTADKGDFPNLPEFFTSEINALEAANPKVHRTVVRNEEPEDTQVDSVDWKEELSIFEMLDLSSPKENPRYSVSVDSSGNLKIATYSAFDSTRELQRVAITERNGKIELLEAFLKKRTFVVDRDTRLSYQPGKGYGIQIAENYIWSKPKTKEIFAEIEAMDFLKK